MERRKGKGELANGLLGIGYWVLGIGFWYWFLGFSELRRSDIFVVNDGVVMILRGGALKSFFRSLRFTKFRISFSIITFDVRRKPLRRSVIFVAND